MKHIQGFILFEIVVYLVLVAMCAVLTTRYVGQGTIWTTILCTRSERHIRYWLVWQLFIRDVWCAPPTDMWQHACEQSIGWPLPDGSILSWQVRTDGLVRMCGKSSARVLLRKGVQCSFHVHNKQVTLTIDDHSFVARPRACAVCMV